VARSVPEVSQTAMAIMDEIGAIKSLLIHGASGGEVSITIQFAKEANRRTGSAVWTFCNEY